MPHNFQGCSDEMCRIKMDICRGEDALAVSGNGRTEAVSVATANCVNNRTTCHQDVIKTQLSLNHEMSLAT